MRRFFLIILGIIITGSIIGNIRTQYNTLIEAEKQNLKIEKEISVLNEENQILKQKIEYATRSAFIEQEVHDKLALGKDNETWLKLKQEENLNLFPKVNEVEEVPKIRQWIKLFTQ